MVNENKVKLMTEMARYETKNGDKDFKISSYYRKDYVSFHAIMTGIWVTIGYAIAVGLIILTLAEELMENFNLPFIITAVLFVVAGYVSVVAIYVIVAIRFYNKKHEDARRRVKIYNHKLTRLNRMYEKEN